MSVIFILISISMIVAGCFLVAFLWAVKSGQYDDSHTPAVRILFEDKVKNKHE
jgi:cbb3-type cytochrome oxidase maturation protein